MMRVVGGGMLAVVLAATGWADTVTLKSGAVIRGEVVAEDTYEVRVVVSRSTDGDLRTERVIAQAQVAAVERGAPDVAVEQAPDAPSKAAAVAGTLELPDATDMQAAVRRADQLSADGRYDDAVAGYRATAEDVERRLATHPTSVDPSEQLARLAHMEVRRDACNHLLICLQGKRDLLRETLKTADASAKDLEDRIGEHRDEMESLDEDDDDDREGNTRRLGEASARVDQAERRRELEADIARGMTRLQAHRVWAAGERQAIVNLETEIDLASEQAGAAEDAYEAAKRAARIRR